VDGRLERLGEKAAERAGGANVVTLPFAQAADGGD
jgi:hypothetical protein